MNIRKFAVLFTLLAVLVAGTVVSAGALTPMHVSGFKLSFGTGQAKASMRIQDSLNRPVAGAKVKVSFEKDGAPVILRSGMTGLFGRTIIAASLPAGNWKVCVEEVHKIGFDYNPLTNLCSAIRVP
jgi:hypothetical protein